MKKIVRILFVDMAVVAFLISALVLVAVLEARGQQVTINAAKGEPVPDSIVVRFMRGIVSETMEFAELIRMNRPDRNGGFNFDLGARQPIAAFTVQVNYGREIQHSATFYARPGDKVEISFAKGIERWASKSMRPILREVHGQGRELYLLCERLQWMGDRIWKPLIRKVNQELGSRSSKGKLESEVYVHSQAYRDFLEGITMDVIRAERELRDTIASYEPAIGKPMANFLRYERGQGSAFFSLLQVMYNRMGTSASKKVLEDFYRSNMDRLLVRAGEDGLYPYGQVYRTLMGYYAMQDTYFENGSRNYSFGKLYGHIKKNYDGLFRDILLTRLFITGKYNVYMDSTVDRDSCLRDALTFVSNPELRQTLLSKAGRTGEKFQEFTFFRPDGSTFGTDDLKGKVYMVDFYYNGCGSCAEFAERFEKEIYPEFRDNNNFVMLSVNTDSKRERWLDAIQSGLYAHTDAIQLATGSGFGHPIFSSYGISSMPWVVLVDREGKIVELKLSHQSNDNIRGLLRQALSNSTGD